MSTWLYDVRFYLKIFLFIYILLGGLSLWLYSQITLIADIKFHSLNDILLILYLFLPTIFAIAALIALISNKGIKVTLWLCSLYWIFNSVGELLEGRHINPSAVYIWSTAILSMSCIIFLLLFRGKNQYLRSISTLGSAKK